MKKNKRLQKGFVSLLPSEAHRGMRWKNGRGESREIAFSPPEASLSAGNFNWRLSLADVAEAGSFSLFPGFDRWITVVDPGKILTLKVGAAKPIVLKPEDVFHFSGDENTEAQIPNGKLRDLSFIYRRDLVKADMKVVEFSGKPRSFSLTHGQVLLFGVEGRFNISAYPGEHQFSLGPGDAICVDEAPEQVERLLLIEPEPGSGSMVAIEIKKNK